MNDGLESARSNIGYELKAALPEIIDNAIDAKAQNIDVAIAMDFSGQILVSVADTAVAWIGMVLSMP